MQNDWSALTAPDASLGEDARAAMEALGRDRRAGLSQALGTILNRQLAETIHPWFSSGAHEWADVDVYAAEMRDGSLVLHFVADHYNYNFAQSGSDWADHYIFAGEALIVGGKRKHQTFELKRHVHLTEREHEGYDSRAAVDAVRAEMRGKRREKATTESGYRCPQCRSGSVESTLLYDAYQLKCGGCGHSQVFETYPEQESDADWIA